MQRQLKRNSLLKLVNDYLYDSLLPMNLNYWFNFGSILGLCLIIQIITGILLAFYYCPNINIAFDSIEYLMREIQGGWLIRYTHANGAAVFFIIVYLHIARGLLYGSYIGHRAMTWRIGVIIFLIMILTAFIGYSLVFGQMSYWAVTVITSLLSVIPFVGHNLVEYIWGGFTVGNATLTRFYSLHYLLPFIIAGLVIAHLITLHASGGTNPLGISSTKSLSQINFHPYYSFKDFVGFLVAFLFLFLLVFFYPNLLGHSDNYIPADSLVTPAEIVPEFYFLGFYSILRSIPNKLLGVIALVSAILILLFIPNLHLGLINSSKFRPIYKYSLMFFLFNYLLLSWTGQCTVAEPYIFLGQLFTFYYFFFLAILIPFISFVETLFFILLSKTNK